MLANFDALEPVKDFEFFTEGSGTWRGELVESGHALDGILEVVGWYGKRFHSEEHVDPLLWQGPPWAPEERFSISFPFLMSHPVLYPLLKLLESTVGELARPHVVALGSLIARESRSQARLRVMEFRGKAGVAMVYDFLPVIDHFRIVDANTVLGVMDEKGDVCDGETQYFFFRIRRDTRV